MFNTIIHRNLQFPDKFRINLEKKTEVEEDHVVVMTGIRISVGSERSSAGPERRSPHNVQLDQAARVWLTPSPASSRASVVLLVEQLININSPYISS